MSALHHHALYTMLCVYTGYCSPLRFAFRGQLSQQFATLKSPALDAYGSLTNEHQESTQSAVSMALSAMAHEAPLLIRL